LLCWRARAFPLIRALRSCIPKAPAWINVATRKSFNLATEKIVCFSFLIVRLYARGSTPDASELHRYRARAFKPFSITAVLTGAVYRPHRLEVVVVVGEIYVVVGIMTQLRLLPPFWLWVWQGHWSTATFGAAVVAARASLPMVLSSPLLALAVTDRGASSAWAVFGSLPR
jgi:hypothetical protein